LNDFDAIARYNHFCESAASYDEQHCIFGLAGGDGRDMDWLGANFEKWARRRGTHTIVADSDPFGEIEFVL
jgi:hypothetical protein